MENIWPFKVFWYVSQWSYGRIWVAYVGHLCVHTWVFLYTGHSLGKSCARHDYVSDLADRWLSHTHTHTHTHTIRLFCQKAGVGGWGNNHNKYITKKCDSASCFFSPSHYLYVLSSILLTAILSEIIPQISWLRFSSLMYGIVVKRRWLRTLFKCLRN